MAAGLRLIVAAAAFAALAEANAAEVGNAERGRLLLRQYGCASCHTIPGVAAARGNVGPPLAGIARRAYVAGILPNTPSNLARWIQAPQTVDPLTRMPDMQVPPDYVQDMVAYLSTLK